MPTIRQPCTTPGCRNTTPCPDHPHKPWAHSKARRRARGATLTSAQEARRRKRIMRRDNGICHICHHPFADQIDHIIPLAEDGDDEDHNLAPIHAHPCHAAKTAAERARGRARAQGRPPPTGGVPPRR